MSKFENLYVKLRSFSGTTSSFGEKNSSNSQNLKFRFEFFKAYSVSPKIRRRIIIEFFPKNLFA